MAGSYASCGQYGGEKMAVSGMNVDELLQNAKWYIAESTDSQIKAYQVEYNNYLYQVLFNAEDSSIIGVFDSTYTYTRDSHEIEQQLKRIPKLHEYITTRVKKCTMTPNSFDEHLGAVKSKVHGGLESQEQQDSKAVTIGYELLHKHLPSENLNGTEIQQYLRYNPDMVAVLIERKFANEMIFANVLLRNIRRESAASEKVTPPSVSAENVSQVIEQAEWTETTTDDIQKQKYKAFECYHKKLGILYTIIIGTAPNTATDIHVVKGRWGSGKSDDISMNIERLIKKKRKPQNYLEQLVEKKKPLEFVLNEYVII